MSRRRGRTCVIYGHCGRGMGSILLDLTKVYNIYMGSPLEGGRQLFVTQSPWTGIWDGCENNGVRMTEVGVATMKSSPEVVEVVPDNVMWGLSEERWVEVPRVCKRSDGRHTSRTTSRGGLSGSRTPWERRSTTRKRSLTGVPFSWWSDTNTRGDVPVGHRSVRVVSPYFRTGETERPIPVRWRFRRDTLVHLDNVDQGVSWGGNGFGRNNRRGVYDQGSCEGSFEGHTFRGENPEKGLPVLVFVSRQKDLMFGLVQRRDGWKGVSEE